MPGIFADRVEVGAERGRLCGDPRSSAADLGDRRWSRSVSSAISSRRCAISSSLTGVDRSDVQLVVRPERCPPRPTPPSIVIRLSGVGPNRLSGMVSGSTPATSSESASCDDGRDDRRPQRHAASDGRGDRRQPETECFAESVGGGPPRRPLPSGWLLLGSGRRRRGDRRSRATYSTPVSVPPRRRGP